MKTADPIPTPFDEYIAPYPPKVRAILKRVRLAILKAAPEAEEKISYRMPSFVLNGVLAYDLIARIVKSRVAENQQPQRLSSKSRAVQPLAIGDTD